jgi:hypothetical protein
VKVKVTVTVTVIHCNPWPVLVLNRLLGMHQIEAQERRFATPNLDDSSGSGLDNIMKPADAEVTYFVSRSIR